MMPLPLWAGLLALSVPLASGDYADNTVDWNASGYLRTTATEARVDLKVDLQFNLSRALPGDILYVLYPTAPLPSDDLLRFVRDGGHLIIADDHGTSGAFLKTLGIQRAPGAPRNHARWYRDLTGLPVLTTEREHFLFFNVDEVTANYPARLRGAGEPLLSFDDGLTHLIVELKEGSGAILVLADASLFLNEMMRRFYGNKQLAANVLRYYCESENCTVTLVPPDGRIVGAYRASRSRFAALGRVTDGVARGLNDGLTRAQEALAQRPSVIGLLLVACVFGLFWAMGPVTRQRRSVHRPPVPFPDPMSASGAKARKRGLLGRGEANYAHLAQHLLRAHPTEAGGTHAPGPPHPEAEAARLRIRAEADSLLSSDPPIVDATHFERLYRDLRILNPHMTESHPPGQGADRR